MVTTSDVARRAGVSRPTVSLVLGGARGNVRIPEVTRARVLAAASELGYRRNEIARALISGHNRMLGFLVERADAEATARMLAGALDEADAGDYSLKVLRLAQSRVVDRATIERCVELRLAGVMAIYLDDSSLEELHGELSRHRMPIAVLERGAPAWGLGIVTDDAQAMGLAIDHLRRLGHRKIGFLTFEFAEFEARNAAFRGALGANGAVAVSSSVERAAMEAAARALLELPQPPTAIIGATEPLAMAVLRVAWNRGVRVPENLSVVSYGDLAMAQHAHSPLSAVALPFWEIGRVAVRQLIQTLDDAAATAPTTQHLPATFVARDSTARAPF